MSIDSLADTVMRDLEMYDPEDMVDVVKRFGQLVVTIAGSYVETKEELVFMVETFKDGIDLALKEEVRI